jgi:hypothetical protein
MSSVCSHARAEGHKSEAVFYPSFFPPTSTFHKVVWLFYDVVSNAQVTIGKGMSCWWVRGNENEFVWAYFNIIYLYLRSTMLSVTATLASWNIGYHSHVALGRSRFRVLLRWPDTLHLPMYSFVSHPNKYFGWFGRWISVMLITRGTSQPHSYFCLKRHFKNNSDLALVWWCGVIGTGVPTLKAVKRFTSGSTWIHFYCWFIIHVPCK